MKITSKRILAIVVVLCVMIALILYHKSGKTKENIQKQNTIMIRNTSPFELRNIKVKFNHTYVEKVEKIKLGESIKVKIPENRVYVVNIKISGDTDQNCSFSKQLCGSIGDNTCITVYLGDDMKPSISSNIFNK